MMTPRVLVLGMVLPGLLLASLGGTRCFLLGFDWLLLKHPPRLVQVLWVVLCGSASVLLLRTAGMVLRQMTG
jgi:hypothetical protein